MLPGLLSLVFVSLISPNLALGSKVVLVEDLGTAPTPWVLSRPADADHQFQLSIAVDKGRHVQDALYAVSSPGHERYGKHLSRAEVQVLLSPDGETADMLTAWLSSSGISPSAIRKDRHWIRLTTTVRDANRVLGADYAWFRHPDSGMEVLRTLRYSLPRDVRDKVSLIAPTTRFCSHPLMHQTEGASGRERRSVLSPARTLVFKQDAAAAAAAAAAVAGAAVEASCNTTVTPQCIRELYNLPANPTLSKARGIGVYASQNQVPKFSDFALFTKKVDPTSPPTNFTFLSINNATTDQRQDKDSNQELNFDVQYTATLSSPVPNVVTAVTGDGPAVPDPGDPAGVTSEPWLIWLDALLALPDDQLPHTITTSFGEDEQTLPDGYVQQVCNQMGALGARGVTLFAASGVTLFAASGDSGPGGTCVSNDGRLAATFNPVFPGVCPFVTAVGGTRGTGPERALLSFSSGGVSARFPRPAYQDQAVPPYLNATVGSQFQGLFNPAGRGFPDVSAQSFNATFVDGGGLGGFAGTSAAAPIWAGLVGQINAALIAQNKAPLGFINPWLYSTALPALNDVTTGATVGCNGKSGFGQTFPPELQAKIIPNASWATAQGWDAGTGLGTPDIGKMLQLAMAR